MGHFFLGLNHSQIYSNTCSKFGHDRSGRLTKYAPLHDRFARAEPADCPVRRPIVKCGMLVECSRPMKSDNFELHRVLFSSRLSRTICAITQSERSKHLNRPSPYSNTKQDRWRVYECTETRRPSCFETFAYPLTWNSFVEAI